jgi:hypothetical protein
MTIVAGFLSGQSLSFLSDAYHKSAVEIYRHLQQYFREWKTEESMTTAESDGSQVLSCERVFVQLNEQILQKDRLLLSLATALEKAQEQISTLIQRNCAMTIQHDQEMNAEMMAHKMLEEIISAERDKTRILQKELDKQDCREGALEDLLGIPNWIAGEPFVETLSPIEKRALRLFYERRELSIICSKSGLAAPDIFRLLQHVFCQSDCRLLVGVNIPTNWQLDQDALLKVVHRPSFLFSLAIFDRLFSCSSIQDLIPVLALAFDEFSRYPDRQWQIMAAFVLEIAFESVVYDAETIGKSQEEMTRLRSLRGRLTRRCRTVRDENKAEILALQLNLRQLRSEISQLEEKAPFQRKQTQVIIHSDSQIWADIFDEIIMLAQKLKSARRHSDHIYYVAAVILFRSASTYEFLRHPFPFPSVISVYQHFQASIDASLTRLESLQQIVPFLSDQISLYQPLTDGVTLAIDAVSCTNVFVGMKHVERSEAAYLFLIYLQPLYPNMKCTPLFVIRISSGISNSRIQANIDAIVQLTKTCIPRIFIASDGDSQYNDRDKIFLAYWIKILTE